MEVVLRTPNGEAEISVVGVRHDLTLADLVDRVTGRAAPSIVYVDGRAVPSDTSMGTSGALEGSIISTIDDRSPAPGVVELVQVAGTGSGTRVWLTAGRYHLGVGRRTSAAELDMAQVEAPRVELRVSPEGDVSVRSFDVRARLDGAELDAERSTDWSSGLIDVAGRVFAIGRREPPTSGQRFAGGSVDGTATFNRPPRSATSPDAPPIDIGNDRPSPTRADRAGFSAAAAERHLDDRDQRRAAHPDLARVIEIAERTQPELWQRRPEHPDAFQIPIGLADLGWSPDLERVQRVIPDAQTIVDALGPVPMVPVVVDLLAARGVGIVGGPEFNEAMARGLLLEASVLHGPADLDVVVVTSGDRVDVWEWTKWLPHVRRAGVVRVLSTMTEIRDWSLAVRRGWTPPSRPITPTHLTVVVVDEPEAWRDRDAPLRPLLSEPSLPVRYVALTGAAVDAPAVCTTLVSEQPGGRARVEYLLDRRHVGDVIPFVASAAIALRTARRLAPLDDPDVPMAAETALPPAVRLLELLGVSNPSADALAARWARRPSAKTGPKGTGPVTTIGVGEHGPVHLDLVDGGPHVLVAGANGLPELLQALVVGLAADSPPDEINFVLIGGGNDGTTSGIAGPAGSGFGPCVELAHTVVALADGDARPLQRLLRSLGAEVQRREAVLRDAGAATFAEVERQPDTPTLPRLVVVVAELSSLGGHRQALLDIGRRGGELGIHLVLGTRHAASVVDDAIGSLVNTRISLQARDDGDSIAAIGSTDAARLPGRVPGRGVTRFGTGEIVVFQAASVSGPATPSDGERGTAALVEPFVVGRELTPMEHRLVRRNHAPNAVTDLNRIVAAVNGAAVAVGQSEQRRPMADPLPEHLALAEFFADHPGDAVPYGLVDLPDQQCQMVTWWTPGTEASLLAYGRPGSATSSLLTTLAIGVAERHAADDVHLYVIDSGANVLGPLRALPHVGAVVEPGESERVGRLVTYLMNVIEDRTALARDGVAASEPAIVLMIDDFGTLRQQLDQQRNSTWDDLQRVIATGPAVGIATVITADQERAVPASIVGQIANRLVLQLDDPSRYAAFGLTVDDVDATVPGRAVRLLDGAPIQLVEAPGDLAAVVRSLDSEPPRDRPVVRIDPLPSSVSFADVAHAAKRLDGAIVAPVGLDVRTVRPALLELMFGEPVVVTGPPGSGRSSVLVACALSAQRVDPPIPVFALAPRGGPLGEVSDVDRAEQPNDVEGWVERVLAARGPRLVLVDDADRLGGPSVNRLAGIDDGNAIVVIAGRNEELRAAGHWSHPLRPFRRGVLIRPTLRDGDVVEASLGPRVPNLGPHHGIMVTDAEQVPVLIVDGEVT